MAASRVTPELSERQRAALAALRAFQRRHGVPPTRAELGKQLGVSPQTADFHLRALERKGVLELRPLSARAMRETAPAASASTADAPRRRAGTRAAPARSARTVAAAPAARMIPLLGRVAAGSPLLALEDVEGEVPLPAGCRADFALRVQGDSMIEAGILPGDLVLVAQTRSAASGEIVVALLGEGEAAEATVKRLRTRGRRIVLEPANRRLRPRTVDPAEGFALAGRVVGVLRWWA
jgi:repressor LexA